MGSVLLFFQYNNAHTIPEGIEIGDVSRGLVENVVNETGFVRGVHTTNLSFQSPGKIKDINVTEGDYVLAGDTIATLDESKQFYGLVATKSQLDAERLRLSEMIDGADVHERTIAEKNLLSAEVALQNAQEQLMNTQTQQDLLVANARNTFLSSSLEATLLSEKREDTSRSYAPPLVSGTYTGDEGVYVLELYSSNALSGSSLKFSGLETGVVPISTVAPVAVGSKGLFVLFPKNFALNTRWEISIPNSRSSVYVLNKNAYDFAQKTRDVAISSAKMTVSSADAYVNQVKAQFSQVTDSVRPERIAAQRSLVQQIEAHVSESESILDETIIKAPFSGIVGNISIERGQVVNAGVSVMSIVPKSEHEIVADISEVDIAEITVGDTVVITLDAYDGVSFSGVVSRVAPIILSDSGVRVIPVTITLDAEDSRMKDGFTAQVDILAIRKDSVLRVPSRSVYEDENGFFVRVVDDGDVIHKVRIKTGIRGTNGYTEIIDGLKEWQRIITFATDEGIAKIEQNQK